MSLQEIPQNHRENGLDLVVYRPELKVFNSPEEVDFFAASQFIEVVQTNPAAAITCPTGSTPIPMWGLLTEANRQGYVDFSDTRFYNLDEYWPLPPGHPASYAAYMRKHFVDRTDVQEAHWYIPNCAAPDPYEEAARYERVLRDAGGIDLAVLGLGPALTCHIGFNERPSFADSRTRYVELDPVTAAVNGQFFTDPSEMPAGAITQGVGNILEAIAIMVLVKGTGKAQGVARSLLGPISEDAPAAFLRLRPNVTWVMDREAASLLNE